MQELYPREVALMRWCLSSDPQYRPSCTQLLAPDSSILWLHRELGGPTLSTTPLCGSSSPSSNNTPSGSPPSGSPHLSPLPSPALHGCAGPVSSLLSYLDYNLQPSRTMRSPGLTALTAPGQTSPLTGGPPALELSASLIRKTELTGEYRSLDPDALVALLVERDDQIEALQAQVASLEDQLLANSPNSSRSGLEHLDL